jgi:MFS family permease
MKYKPYWMCLLGALFYFYEFILQVAPAVITNDLMRDLSIHATGLGFVSAAYYYAYTPVQIIAGVLYDRFGVKKLLTIMPIMCAIGACMLACAHHLGSASLARFIMGFASAFSYIGTLILIAQWFPPHQFARLTGITQIFNSLGGLVGQMPFAMASEWLGWRIVFFFLAIVGILLGFIIHRFLEESYDKVTPKRSFVGEIQHLKAVFIRSQTWWIGLYSFLVWAPLLVFAGLWGVPYLVETYHISAATAGASCSLVWWGTAISGPFVGWWSDAMGKRNPPLLCLAILGAIAVSITIYFEWHFTLVLIGLLMLGLAGTAQGLIFSVVKEINRSDRLGTAIGVNNMFVVAGGAVFQPLVGILLAYQWHGAMQNGVRHYASNDYAHAMIILPVCFIVAALIVRYKIKETFCSTVYIEHEWSKFSEHDR